METGLVFKTVMRGQPALYCPSGTGASRVAKGRMRSGRNEAAAAAAGEPLAPVFAGGRSACKGTNGAHVRVWRWAGLLLGQ